MSHCWAVAEWHSISGLRHGFYGRIGGGSRGAFASFNLSDRVGDAPRAVEANRRHAARMLEPLRLVVAHQVHGDGVAVIDDADCHPGEVDGLLTAKPCVALGVLTADCVPILLVGCDERVAAVAHAGWRGTVQEVVVRVVEQMRIRFGIPPDRIRAALGPAIGPCCYEVGEDVISAVVTRHGECPGILRSTRVGHGRLDLRGINSILLERCGIPPAQIALVGPCTSCASNECFSHRADRGRTGRQLSFVGWEPQAL